MIKSKKVLFSLNNELTEIQLLSERTVVMIQLVVEEYFNPCPCTKEEEALKLYSFNQHKIYCDIAYSLALELKNNIDSVNTALETTLEEDTDDN